MADLNAIADSIANLTLKEATELSGILKDKYKIEPAAGGVAVAVSGPAAQAGPAKAAEKTEFDLVLKAAGEQKIKVIKVVRELTNLGLTEAKALVDGAPKPVLTKKTKAEAEDGKKKLEEAGATVEIA